MSETKRITFSNTLQEHTSVRIADKMYRQRKRPAGKVFTWVYHQ